MYLLFVNSNNRQWQISIDVHSDDRILQFSRRKTYDLIRLNHKTLEKLMETSNVFHFG